MQTEIVLSAAGPCTDNNNQPLDLDGLDSEPAPTSVSLFRFHRSRRPARSTQANSAGCVGDHMES